MTDSEHSRASGAARLAPFNAQQSDATTRLAGSLHEVSNALTVVLGWLAEARSLAGPETPVAQALDVAYAHAKRGHAVARAAIGAPVGEAHGARAVSTLLAEAGRAATPEATRRHVELVIGEAELDARVSDWETVSQILINLLLNALAFAPAGSAVSLECELRGSRALFVVTDKGAGVPQELRGSLFAGVQSQRPGGAGIGLSHSYALARSHGGQLRLGSSDVGARFELEWPLSDEPSQAIATAPEQGGISGMRVVVLEDDPAVSSMVEFGLQSRGVEVSSVSTERELLALKPVAGASFDAALVDLSPIEKEPAAALERFRQLHGAVPIVLISGTAIADTENLPLSGWVEKPFELGELYAALASLRREANRAAQDTNSSALG